MYHAMIVEDCVGTARLARECWPKPHSSLDLDDVPSARCIIERVGEFARCLGMDIQQRLAAIDLVAEQDRHIDTRGFFLGIDGQLGERSDARRFGKEWGCTGTNSWTQSP